MLDVPLSPEEVQGLLSDGTPLEGKVREHVLVRILATLDNHQRQSSQAARDLAAFASGGHNGRPTSLSPVDAVRYLSDEQKAAVFNTQQRQLIEHAQNANAEAEAYRAKIVAFLERAQGARAWLVSGAVDVPAETSAALVSMFDHLLNGSD